MMNKVLITGDIHATIDISKLTDFRRKFKNDFDKNDILIIAGDFGFIWTDEPCGEEQYWLNWLDEFAPWTTVFIDGNHENHPRLNSYPETTFCGARAHQISKTVYHIIRGEILELNDMKILCMGGADSHDKYWRVENMDWWADERISDKDVENALQNLNRFDNKVDYVVSHSFPSSILLRFFPYMKETPSSDQLDVVLGNVEFAKSWISGHYHEDMGRKEREGFFRVIYDDIIMLWGGEEE